MSVYLRWREDGTERDDAFAPDEAVKVVRQDVLDAGGGDTEVMVTYQYA